MLTAGDVDGAKELYQILGYSEDQIKELSYSGAEELLTSGDIKHAALAFGRLGDYRDAKSRSLALWDEIAVRETLSAGGCTVGLRSNGTVVAAGNNNSGQCNVGGWTDIVAVAAAGYYSAGLRSDGTVIVAGAIDRDVDEWTGITAIAAGYDYIVGLRSDGTVVAVGKNDYGECNMSGWTDIKQPAH